MRAFLSPRSVAAAVLVLASTGCTWVTEQVVDNVVGVPASDLVRDVKKTSDEYDEDSQQQRTDELQRDYEDFSQPSKNETNDDAVKSIVVTEDEDDTDYLTAVESSASRRIAHKRTCTTRSTTSHCSRHGASVTSLA